MIRFLILATIATATFATAGDDGTDAAAVNTADNGSGNTASGDGDGADGNAVPSRSFWRRLQFHGTLSQGFTYGSDNNYLTMDSNSGSARWSGGAVNLGMAITDNFRVGVQVHSYIMGEIGRGNVQIDWAFADYRLKEWLGFRGGKLKAPMGLFGEVEDTDTLYNWALLPQSMYEAEYGTYNVRSREANSTTTSVCRLEGRSLIKCSADSAV